MLASQLTVEISDVSGGVSFEFFNDVDAGGVSGSIKTIEFIDTLGLFDYASVVIDLFSGTDSAVDYDFNVAETTATAVPPPSARGVNETGESAMFTFDWTTSGTVDPDLLDAIVAGLFDIRLHVISINGPNGTVEQSDWFHLTYTPPNDPPNDPPVPEPATAGLVALGLAAIAFRARRIF